MVNLLTHRRTGHLQFAEVQAEQAAELRFTNLLTGCVQLTLTLEVSGGGAEPQTVQLPQLPAGQYMYRLLINGQPVAVPQRFVTLP